jgi:CubicO group peptidase (beta-lactamase class C family)
VDEAFRGELGWRAEEGGFSHTGFTGGFLFLHPESRRVRVLLANHLHPDARAGDMDDVRRRFREAALAIS